MTLLRASRGRRRLAGALFVLLLGTATAGALWASGRTLGAGRHFEVEFMDPGALHADARLLLAGRAVGEVRGLRRESDPGGARRVIADVFVTARYAAAVRTNSELFVATPSILGEACLAIGATRGAPAAAVAEGQRLRGSDPPVLDQFVARAYTSLVELSLLARQQGPALDELLQAGDALLTTLSGLPEGRGELRRISRHLGQAIEDAIALGRALEGSQVTARVRALAAQLGETARRIAPELVALSERSQRAMARLDSLGELLPPERRLAVSRALDALAAAATIGEAIAGDVEALVARLERGQGTLAAFVADRELYEELHEIHRILKNQPWTLIVKPAPGQKTTVR